ncbi:hypothetical protein HK098_001619 [Nowakowskiella sp. JEL0407]|nr:hypothetical protein HK098_001619 [Nowakowskiella sp. JEL0407]
MLKISFVAAVVSVCISFVNAHGAVTDYIIDGTAYDGYHGFAPTGQPTIQWQWKNYDPMFTPTDSNIMCNGGTSAGLSAPVKPGSNVTAHWSQWTHSEGPCTAYLYKCDGAFSSCDGKKKQWFKIGEVGLVSGTYKGGVWCGTQIMNTKKWSVTIPQNLVPGNYLIRHELMALHQANNPQFYPECAQLTVSGSGTDYPTSEYFTSFPGYAQLSDSNIKIDIDVASAGATVYKVPGPPLWKGSSAVSSPSPVSPSPSPVSPSPKVTSPAATCTSPVALNGQV